MVRRALFSMDIKVEISFLWSNSDYGFWSSFVLETQDFEMLFQFYLV